MVFRCDVECAVSPSRGTRRFTRTAWCTVVERSTNDLQLRVLVVHRSLYVSVSHGFHDGGEVPRSHENPGSIIVTRTIQNEILWEPGFNARVAKQVADRPQVPGRRTL